MGCGGGRLFEQPPASDTIGPSTDAGHTPLPALELPEPALSVPGAGRARPCVALITARSSASTTRLVYKRDALPGACRIRQTILNEPRRSGRSGLSAHQRVSVARERECFEIIPGEYGRAAR